MKSNDWLHGFRHSSPYINAHRGRTVVLTLGGEALAHENLINIIHDITLLSSLGVKLVVAFGARPQIQQRFDQAGLDAHFHEGLRVTPEGRLFVRNICMAFDRYMMDKEMEKPVFSRTV